MPKPVATSLISVAQIVDNGYSVHFKPESVSILNDNGTEVASYKRGNSLSWKVPLNLLNKLTRRKDNTKKAYSGRLHTTAMTPRERVMELHGRMAHAAEDTMCSAIEGDQPVWRNVNVSVEEIRTIFNKEPCLHCTMCKRRKDGTGRWIEKSKARTKDLLWMDNSGVNQAEIEHKSKPQPERDREWGVGECITVDNIGPINPASIDGFKYFFIFKDIKSKKIFTFLVKTCNEESYLRALEEVLEHFAKYGHRTKVVRSDYYSTFLSSAVKEFEGSKGVIHESSSPYLHWQNAVEREVQTMYKFVSTLLHAQAILRMDVWSYALTHWTMVYNTLPHATTGDAPNRMVDPTSYINARYKFRMSFGDLITFGVPKPRRKSKFDSRNDLGFYLGDAPGMKGAVQVFHPYDHKVRIRADAYKLNVSTLQYLSWYGRRANLKESGLPYRIVHEAVMDLLNDVEDEDDPKYKADIPVSYWTDPGETEEELEPIPDVEGSDSSSEEEQGGNDTEQNQSRKDAPPSRVALVAQQVRDAVQSFLKHEDESEVTKKAMHQAYLESVHQEVEEGAEEVNLKEALQAQDKDKFVDAIKKEVNSLLMTTKTLKPITREEEEALRQAGAVEIGTTVKVKRKKRGDGTIEKHKARSAARGDTFQRILAKSGRQTPPSYSPTVSTLAFMTLLQLSTIRGWHMGTADITSAYLQVDYPHDAVQIITQFEPKIAEICGLDARQKYQIKKCLYGLPDSGRQFYQLYKKHLEEEGFTCSRTEPCLFFKRDDTGLVYILIHVDDTFIFTDKEEKLSEFVAVINRRMPMTLDEKGDSFLGIKIEQHRDGSIELSQPKLLSKILKASEKYKQDREVKTKRQTKRASTHPYGPSSAKPRNKNPFSKTEYLRLVGMLLYLTRSRPDIMTAVSFAATKSSDPEEEDLYDVLEIIKYLEETKDLTYKLRTTRDNRDGRLRIVCEVDASYLTHPDSKSHTGYGFRFGNLINFFFAKSSKQTDTATSSTHSEMKALYTLIKDILFLVQLFADIQEDLGLPVVVLEDNAAVVTLAMEETGQLKRSKHFAMITNFVKDCIGKGIIEIRKIAGSDNTADILTKKVRSGEFQRKAMKMLGHAEDEEPKDKDTKENAKGTTGTKENDKGTTDTKENAKGTTGTKENDKGTTDTKENDKGTTDTKENTKGTTGTKEHYQGTKDNAHGTRGTSGQMKRSCTTEWAKEEEDPFHAETGEEKIHHT
jgi:hypothetical protein